MSKTGYLVKMGGSVKSWKKRYFVLKTYNLFYYKDEATFTSQKPELGVVAIVDCTITKEEAQIEQPGYYFLLSLQPGNNAKRNEYVLVAETEEERTSWIDALNKVNAITVYGSELSNALRVNPTKVGTFIPIPFFIVKAFDYIEKEGLDTEGIYRINGSQHKIQQFVVAINMNVDFNFESYGVLETTGIVKSYLRSLKSPIFMYENFEKLKQIMGIPLADQISRLRELIRSLPIPNYVFLEYLSKHMAKIKSHSGKNLMNTKALAVCFGPCIIWEKDGDPQNAFLESKIQQEICTLLIDQYDAVFPHKLLMSHSQQGNQSFNVLVQEQDTRWPYTLHAPLNSVVQKVVEDKTGWTICVMNDKWGCVHKNSLSSDWTNRPANRPGLIHGLRKQKSKWELSPEELSSLGVSCPQAVQLYTLLKQRIDIGRQKLH